MQMSEPRTPTSPQPHLATCSITRGLAFCLINLIFIVNCNHNKSDPTEQHSCSSTVVSPLRPASPDLGGSTAQWGEVWPFGWKCGRVTSPRKKGEVRPIGGSAAQASGATYLG